MERQLWRLAMDEDWQVVLERWLASYLESLGTRRGFGGVRLISPV